MIKSTFAQILLNLVLRHLRLLARLLLGRVARRHHQCLRTLVEIILAGHLPSRLHDHLLLGLNERVNLLDDLGWDWWIGWRLYPPWPIRSHIDIAKKRSCRSTLLCGQSCVNLASAELLDLPFLRGIVLAIISAQRLNHPVGPTSDGVAVVSEDLVLTFDVPTQLRHQLLRLPLRVRIREGLSPLDVVFILQRGREVRKHARLANIDTV